MRRRPLQRLQAQPSDPVESALARARRARRQGKLRAEVNALKAACMLREFDARLWTMLGAAYVRLARLDEAAAAFRHALWLRERQGDAPRAAVTRRLLEGIRGPRTRAA